jgi:hypothetical protein
VWFWALGVVWLRDTFEIVADYRVASDLWLGHITRYTNFLYRDDASAAASILVLYITMFATRRNQPAESKVFYEVPTLSNATLLRCLKEIQLPFTEEDLMKPTAQSTQYLFERCLDLLMGVHTTQIEEVRDKMLQTVEHHVSVLYSFSRCRFASAD